MHSNRAASAQAPFPPIAAFTPRQARIHFTHSASKNSGSPFPV
jgi:hypothetical protein